MGVQLNGAGGHKLRQESSAIFFSPPVSVSFWLRGPAGPEGPLLRLAGPRRPLTGLLLIPQIRIPAPQAVLPALGQEILDISLFRFKMLIGHGVFPFL